MMDRKRFLLVLGIDVDRWIRRYELEPFAVQCECGRTRETSIPFATRTHRGMIAPPCPCGALAPYCVVSLDGGIPHEDYGDPAPATAYQENQEEAIQRAVCAYYGVEVGALKSRSRARGVAFPRMVAMYLCRQRIGLEFKELAELFGVEMRTATSSVRKISTLIREDPAVVNAVDAIERRLEG